MANPIGPEQQVGAQTKSDEIIEFFSSRDVTEAMLVSLNKGTAAMLVSPTNPPGIELYSYANIFFCFSWSTRALIA